MDGDKGDQPTDDELDVQLARRVFAMHVYRRREPEFVPEWASHGTNGHPHVFAQVGAVVGALLYGCDIPSRSFDGVRRLPCFVGSAQGQAAMLAMLVRSAVGSLRIDYDRCYGDSARAGWSVAINGRVVIQFARSYGVALACALLTEFE